MLNQDHEDHSVTSQGQLGAYVPGAVDGISFDTGVFAEGSRTITIPGDAAPGTVIPYFCTVHPVMMANDGRITVNPGTGTVGGVA